MRGGEAIGNVGRDPESPRDGKAIQEAEEEGKQESTGALARAVRQGSKAVDIGLFAELDEGGDFGDVHAGFGGELVVDVVGEGEKVSVL